MAGIMTHALVTGGTGFLGRHLLDALVGGAGRDPGEVRVFCRHGDPELTARGFQVIEGTVASRPHLAQAAAGCDVVFHLAGRVDRSPESLGSLMRVHVEGTRNVVHAAAEAGVRRVVYVSTSGTIGVGRRPDFLATEDDPFALEIVRKWPYYLSKVYAEQAAEQAAQDTGADVVTVNPTLLLGPGDDRMSSTGDVLRFLRRQIPSVPSGGMSFVDARDVAAAVVAVADPARDKVRAGRRYLLTAANWTIDKFLRRLESISGVRAPVLKLPDAPSRWAAAALQWGCEALGRTAPLDRISVEMSQHYWYCDAARAQRELGFLPRDPDETLRDTVDDLRRRYGLDGTARA